MVMNAPKHQHSIIYSGTELPDSELFDEVRQLPAGIFRRTRSVRDLVSESKPDVIHAHSSWGGVYARLVPQLAPVVYEPHCFVFDDPGRSRTARSIFWLAESVLSHRSARIVTLTPHERRMARRLRPGVRTADMVNVPSLRVDPEDKSTLDGGSVTMIGRLAAQKDPSFFAEVARRVHQELPGVRFVWIGDGDSSYRRVLEEAGVEVTGWLQGGEVARRLGDSRVYLHSASFEGFPLSVLDAAEAHVPTIVRDLPCFEGLDLKKVRTAEVAAETIVSGWQDMTRLQAAKERSERLAMNMSAEVQAQRLEELYSSVTSDAGVNHVGGLPAHRGLNRLGG